MQCYTCKNIQQTMTSMNYFDSDRKNQTDFFKRKAVLEIQYLKYSTNLHHCSNFFFYIDKTQDAIKLLAF